MRGTTERGSVTLFVAGAGLALFAVAGLGIDGSRAIAGSLRAAGEAQQACRTGAQLLALPSTYGSAVALDPARASGAAQGYIARTGDTASVSVAGDQLTVSVSTTVSTTLLGLVGVNSFTLTRAATCRAEQGR